MTRARPRSLFAPNVWNQALAALRRRDEEVFIGLDLDGTLAPIARRPESARVAPGTLRLLDQSARAFRVTLIVLSARPRSVLRSLIPVPRVHMIGQYGLEGLPAPAAPRRTRARKAYPDLVLELRNLAAACPGALIEPKGLTVAVHDRGVAPARIPPLRRAIRRSEIRARHRGFQTIGGHRVTDFVPIGHDKGTALRAALARFRPDTAFYFGDSPADEPAFRELGAAGFSVRVGPGPTRALYRVGDLRGVTKFLKTVVRLRGSEPKVLEVSACT